ncbi:MAG: exonuclease domain-containing protein [Acidobacteriota bacterium]
MLFETWQALARENPPIDRISIVAFDTETTGMGSPDRLLEIAGVKFRGRKIAGEFSRLVDPGRPVSPETTAIHGITTKMVRGQWSAREALQEFFAFADDSVLIAHNARFDAGVLAGEYFRSGILPPENPILDSLKLARRTLSCSSYSLEALVRDLPLPREDHHRALPDSRHVFRLFRRICTELATDGNPPLSEILARNGKVITLGGSMPEIPDLPENFQPLREASDQATPVVILYEPREGSTGYRTVTPKLFYRRKEVIYMEAFCHASGYDRCYRLDRIRECRSGGD